MSRLFLVCAVSSWLGCAEGAEPPVDTNWNGQLTDSGFNVPDSYVWDSDAQVYVGPDGGIIFADSSVSDGSVSDAGKTDGGSTDGGSPNTVGTLPMGKDYSGWTWVEVAGSKCRSGSPAGYYYRKGKSNKLMIFLNGGGACADKFFCSLNPADVDHDLSASRLIFATQNLLYGPDPWRQVPGDQGVFKADPRNPVGDWNMVFVPYCTGDIHAGSRENVTIPDVPGPAPGGVHHFVGYKNLGLFLNSFGPAFKSVERILLTGSSAGGFGSLLNYHRVSEYFTGVDVMAVSDSGLPFKDKYMAACLQGKWREYWGLNDAFPADCTECKGSAGGLTEAAFKYYFQNKYKGKMLGGLITTVNDEIIRAFFAPGLNSQPNGENNCTLEPGTNAVVGAFGLNSYDGEMYRQGLLGVADDANLIKPEQMGYYAMAGENHMHLWRANFYETNGNTMTIADWLKQILDKKPIKEGEKYLRAQ